MVSSIAAHTFYKAKSQIQDSEVREPSGRLPRLEPQKTQIRFILPFYVSLREKEESPRPSACRSMADKHPEPVNE